MLSNSKDTMINYSLRFNRFCPENLSKRKKSPNQVDQVVDYSNHINEEYNLEGENQFHLFIITIIINLEI